MPPNNSKHTLIESWHVTSDLHITSQCQFHLMPLLQSCKDIVLRHDHCILLHPNLSLNTPLPRIASTSKAHNRLAKMKIAFFIARCFHLHAISLVQRRLLESTVRPFNALLANTFCRIHDLPLGFISVRSWVCVRVVDDCKLWNTDAHVLRPMGIQYHDTAFTDDAGYVGWSGRGKAHCFMHAGAPTGQMAESLGKMARRSRNNIPMMKECWVKSDRVAIRDEKLVSLSRELCWMYMFLEVHLRVLFIRPSCG